MLLYSGEQDIVNILTIFFVIFMLNLWNMYYVYNVEMYSLASGYMDEYQEIYESFTCFL